MPEQSEHDAQSEVDDNSGKALAQELESIHASSDKEKGEELEPSKFEVRLDRDKMATAEGVPDVMKDWLVRLPETLTFDDPVTLIVGENGSGKTQFARAVIESLSAARNTTEAERDGKKAIGDSLMLDEEPAAEIAPALTVTEPGREGRRVNPVFIEGAEIMYKSREWAKQQAQQARHVSGGGSLLGNSGGRESQQDTHQASSRQLFEQSIASVKKMRVDQLRWQLPDAAVIFDEPEQGLSPQRQLELPETISNFLPQTDTLLVPTNNLALFLSDLPRIDISQPERGVFRPSEYDEAGKIVMAGKTEA